MLAAVLVFLSFAHADKTLAKSVVAELRTAGCDVWTDARIRSGQKWTLELERAIDRADAVLVLVTAASNASLWVISETLYARDAGRTVIPIRPSNARLPVTLEGFQEAHVGRLGTEIGCSAKFSRKEF